MLDADWLSLGRTGRALELAAGSVVTRPDGRVPARLRSVIGAGSSWVMVGDVVTTGDVEAADNHGLGLDGLWAGVLSTALPTVLAIGAAVATIRSTTGAAVLTTWATGAAARSTVCTTGAVASLTASTTGATKSVAVLTTGAAVVSTASATGAATFATVSVVACVTAATGAVTAATGSLFVGPGVAEPDCC
jgi:hypothetical protein